jgi:hypothetical protein
MNPFESFGGPKDWVEDFKDDNGCYMHTCHSCKSHFTGHKRRPSICKECFGQTFSKTEYVPVKDIIYNPLADGGDCVPKEVALKLEAQLKEATDKYNVLFEILKKLSKSIHPDWPNYVFVEFSFQDEEFCKDIGSVSLEELRNVGVLEKKKDGTHEK